MCIKCAMGLSNEAAKKQLEYVVEKKIFDKINTTGAAFILYACVGIFGNNTKQVGLELIKMLNITKDCCKLKLLTGANYADYMTNYK